MSVLNAMLRDLERRGERGPLSLVPRERIAPPAQAESASRKSRMPVRPVLLVAAAATAAAVVWLWPRSAHAPASTASSAPMVTPSAQPSFALRASEGSPSFAARASEGSPSFAARASEGSPSEAPGAPSVPGAKEGEPAAPPTIAPVVPAQQAPPIGPQSDLPSEARSPSEVLPSFALPSPQPTHQHTPTPRPITASVAAPPRAAALESGRPADSTAAALQTDGTAPNATAGSAAPSFAAGVGAPGASEGKPAVAQSSAQLALERAMQQIARGRMSEAAELLTAALTEQPNWNEARSTLAAVQAEAGDKQQALTTLLAGVAFDPARFAPTAAQLQAELHDPAGALQTLDRIPAEARNQNYHRLAGAIAQRAGRHELAAAEYEAALKFEPSNAVAWIGLGVSLQALGRDTEALAAYRSAAGGALSPDLRRFVESRISTLQASVRPVAPEAR